VIFAAFLSLWWCLPLPLLMARCRSEIGKWRMVQERQSYGMRTVHDS
jgi:hypothetical protein